MDAVTGIFSAVPFDYVVLGGVFLALALDSLRNGIGRAAAFAVALPLAVMIHSLLSSAAFVGGIVEDDVVGIGVFGIVIAMMYLLVRRIGLDFLDGGIGQPMQAIIASAAATIVCAVVWLHADSLHTLWNFNDSIQALFAERWRFFWLIGAYAALAFARG